MNSFRVLYDGWPLCHDSNHPAALHLLAILTSLPDTVEPIIAFPETPPLWIPAQVQSLIEPTPFISRLKWEQQLLPHLCQKIEAHLLHLTTESASLFLGQQTIVSPTQALGFDRSQSETVTRPGLFTRLRGALAAGGTARTQALLWPENLPHPPDRETITLPPVVHSDFIAADWSDPIQIPGVELPETYVLYHHAHDISSLRRALEAWTWAADPIGQNYPLVLLGLGAEERLQAQALARNLDIQDTVVSLPAIPPSWIAPLYRRAEILFHPGGISPWGSPLHHALACGKPVVAAETTRASALVGPAAILIAPGDTRRLGASVIGIIVKEPLSARLREAAIARSAGWLDTKWGERLKVAYERVLKV